MNKKLIEMMKVIGRQNLNEILGGTQSAEKKNVYKNTVGAGDKRASWQQHGNQERNTSSYTSKVQGGLQNTTAEEAEVIDQKDDDVTVNPKEDPKKIFNNPVSQSSETVKSKTKEK